MIGSSAPMVDIYKTISLVAPTRCHGSDRRRDGHRQRVDRAHDSSQQPARASSHSLPVDCGAIAPSLIESELFGAVRGAYTGRTGTASGSSRRRIAGRFFWTKSAKSS